MDNIEFQKVSKSYGPLEVVPPLDLSIVKGEFLVLVGPSGCGKTTTLRMLAGLEEVTSGNIFINGDDVTHKRPGERNCAMVFQNYALYPHMTVRDNIGYAMKVHGHDKAEIEKRVSDAGHLLGLDDYLDRKPRNLSGGQRQRVAIGRALVRQPEIFLFDEPLSNLDAKLRVEMRTEIKLLQRRLGTTAVYVTHDQIEAMTMADRVVVMRGGNIEQVDAPINLYEKPANKFVASFIGSPSMNFFQANIVGRSVVLGDQELALAPADIERLADRGPVTFGIRPEHCRNSDSAAELTFKVDVIEPLGASTLVLGKVDGQKIVAQIDPRFPATADELCTVPVDMSAVHFFDPETEARC